MLLVALAGLFAMHGLSDHGAAGQVVTDVGAHATHGSEGPVVLSEEHLQHDVGNAVGSAVEGATDTSTSAAATLLAASPRMASAMPGALTGVVNDPPGHGGHGLLGMCLAVLAAALTLVLATTLVRDRRPLFVTAPGGSVLPTLLARARDPDPPDLRLLSVQRC